MAEETRKIKARAFQAYSTPLKLVTPFKYLGRFITAWDDDFPVVVGNLRKSKKIPSQKSIILGR